MKKYRMIISAVSIFIIMLTICYYFLDLNLLDSQLNKSPFNHDEMSKLESDEISAIVFFTKTNVNKRRVIFHLDNYEHVVLDQLGATRIFEKNNTKYALTETIVYKYFIKWEYVKL